MTSCIALSFLLLCSYNVQKCNNAHQALSFKNTLYHLSFLYGFIVELFLFSGRSRGHFVMSVVWITHPLASINISLVVEGYSQAPCNSTPIMFAST